ncbi:ribonuclease H-like domain-containing protein [Methanocaldococcus sp.]
MAEYYFDIETYSPNDKPNPETDKIITIQYQRINLRSGKPKGKLKILKEWESSERDIVFKFYEKFFSEDKSIWDFIPVGFNLNFEWEFLMTKFNKYLGVKLTSREIYYNRPYIDLKPIVVLLNNGKFRGASLNRFTKKKYNGGFIKEWYENKQYDKIEEYIKNETESYIEFLQKIIKNIHKILD